jgi:hypothetical protein
VILVVVVVEKVVLLRSSAEQNRNFPSRIEAARINKEPAAGCYT